MTHFSLSLLSVDDGPADLHFENGNLVVVEGSEAVGQHVAQRLGTYQGEWFLDTQAGVPWLSDILGKHYDAALAETVTKAEIVNTDGVTEITSFSVRFDSQSRHLSSYNITVNTVYEQEITL